jgi:hypothetical protein
LETGYPVPYFTRLRILARQAGYFFDRLARLGTEYDDCPSICKTPYADPANGCPDCEYTAYYRTFKKNYEAGLRRHYERQIRQSVTDNTLAPHLLNEIVEEEVAKPPAFEDLLTDYGRLLSLEAEAGAETAELPGGFNASWTIRTAEGIRVIREERRKVRRELRKARDAELDGALRSLRGNNG